METKIQVWITHFYFNMTQGSISHYFIFLGLLSLQVLFLREHNRLANEFHLEHPDWDDEKLFQEARRWVIAFMQHITVSEVIFSFEKEPFDNR